MSSLLFQTIDQLSREKGIEPQIIISAVEDAILVAARKYYKTGEDLRSEVNRETGQVGVYAIKKVVEQVQNPLREITLEAAQELDSNAQLDLEVRISKPTDVLGRIAAQAAKQVIFQKVREAERENVYKEYSGRVGELVHCIVKRMEGPDLIVELGKTEARLPRREQSKLESFQIGERVRAIILQVEKSARGPQVIVSRADASLVTRLFEMEVPEIYDGTVVIRAVAREAGERTKVAVFSKDRDVDCVGACVGMKGMRVQSIIRELRGEKIDIIEYSEETATFAAHALSPAKINRVSILDPAAKHLEVIVDDTQLSLAIGKKGQNVRLASKLLGWRIDIKSEEEKRQEVESQMEQLMPARTPLTEITGIGAKTTEKLMAHDITTVERLGEMTPEQLQEIPGIGPKMVERIRLAINNYYMQFEEPGGETTEAAAPVEEREVETAPLTEETGVETPTEEDRSEETDALPPDEPQ
ncbi:MAG: transcription termination/antitermination protein NusA [Acidobacteria bacterium]|nr:transcription termination/antitermination protein NusA [Acidobacteriota bacterium]